MNDETPPPYGDITRQWTHLAVHERDRHARRLLGAAWDPPPGGEGADPTPAEYERLVHAALGGDRIAFAWLATTHRPMMLSAGRALLEDDPTEWGAACLELLHHHLSKARLESGLWLRRHIAVRLKSDLARQVRKHLVRRRFERVTDPVVDMPRLRSVTTAANQDANDDLAAELATALRRVDRPTFEALHALADGRSMSEVADRWAISHDAMRQRVTRARLELQPSFAAYQRGVS